MANRTVAVTITAQVAGYIAGLEQVKKKTSETSEDAQKKLQAQGAAYTELGGIALKAGAVAAAAVGLAIVKFAQFDQAISNVKAATQESAENMGLLREAALDAGASTVFTAAEAANAIEELGKTGLSTAQILNGGLDGALSLASAGQLEVARAAEIASISMKQFGLTGADIPRIADLLAAGAGKAAGDVEDLAQALAQSGLVANQTGLSVEETTGVLSAFADAGLLGSDAGTSLKTALQRLTPQSKEAKDEMDRLGISAYDARGNFIGISKFSGVLQSSLKDLTAEQRNASLGIIFGSDAVRAAAVLYEQGADGIQKYVDQTNDSGYAAKVAADRLDNLAGDVEKLGGAFDTALIRSGSGANDVLRSLTQSATFLVDSVGDLPEPVLAVGLALTSAAAATLLVGGGVLTLSGRLIALNATLAGTGISLKTLSARAAIAGGAVGVATIAVGLLVAQQAEAAATTAELKDSLDDSTGALTEYSREIVAKKLAESGAFDSAKNLGISQKELTDALLEGGDALEEIQGKLAAQNNIVDFFNGSGIAAGNASQSIRDLRNSVVDSQEQFKNVEAATEGSTMATQDATEAYKDAKDEVAGFADELSDLIDLINKSNEVGQDAVTSNVNYQQALADVAVQVENARKGVEGFGLGLDITTQAGRDNVNALEDLASKSQTAAAAQLQLDGDTANYLATVEAGRQTIYDTAIAFGATEAEAAALRDTIYQIPTEAEVQIIADTAAATTAVAQFVRDLNNIPGQRSIVIDAVVKSTGADRGAVAAAYSRATGGAISGPGTGTSDTAGLFRLSNGEHVLTAADVARMGGQAGVYAFRQSLYGGYANGGAVRYAPAAAPSSASGSSAGSRPVVNQTINSLDPYVAADMAAQRLKASLAGL